MLPFRPSVRSRRRLQMLAFAVMLVVAIGRLTGVLDVDPPHTSADWGLADFRDAIYYSGRAMLDGVNPYDVTAYLDGYPAIQHFPLYSPLLPVMHLPITVFPFGVAAWLYAAFTLAMTVVLAYLAHRYAPREIGVASVLGLAAIILASRPGLQNFVVGNNAVLFAVLSTVVIYAWPTARGVPFVLAVIALTAKPHVAVPILILLLVRSRSKAGRRAVAAGVLVTAPFVALFAAWSGGVGPFVTAIRDNLAFDATASTRAMVRFARVVDLGGAVSRITGSSLPTAVQVAVLAAGLVVSGIALRRLAAHVDPRHSSHLSALLITVTTLLFVFHQSYDLLILTVPAYAVWASNAWPEVFTRGRRRVAQASVLVLVLNYGATTTLLNRVGAEHPDPLWFVLTNLNTAALVVLYVVVLATIRDAVSPSRPSGSGSAALRPAA